MLFVALKLKRSLVMTHSDEKWMKFYFFFINFDNVFFLFEIWTCYRSLGGSNLNVVKLFSHIRKWLSAICGALLFVRRWKFRTYESCVMFFSWQFYIDYMMDEMFSILIRNLINISLFLVRNLTFNFRWSL